MRTRHIKLTEATSQRRSVAFIVNGLRHDTPVRLLKLTRTVAATTGARCESNTRLSRSGSDCVSRRCYLRCRAAAPPKHTGGRDLSTRRGAAALKACHHPHAVRRTGAAEALQHKRTLQQAQHNRQVPGLAGPANSSVVMSRGFYSVATKQQLTNSGRPACSASPAHGCSS